MHTHTHTQCTLLRQVTFIEYLVFVRYVAFSTQPVCAVINKGKQGSTLMSCLTVLKENTSSHMFLQQELGNLAELLQLH